MSENKAENLASKWIDAAFGTCDEYERQKFQANVERALTGAELVDDWDVGRLRGAGEAYQAQYVLCEMIRDAVERGAKVPEPIKPTGALARYAANFGEDSAASKVLKHAASCIGWDCAKFEHFDVLPEEFERACRFALVALHTKERNELKFVDKTHTQISDRELEFLRGGWSALGVALYCCNRVDFCHELEIDNNTQYNARLEFRSLAALYRRLYGLGGINQ